MDLIILLLLSLFLGVRLWEQLGKKPLDPSKNSPTKRIIPAHQLVVDKEIPRTQNILFYEGFDESEFLEGAENAFNIIQKLLKEVPLNTQRLEQLVAADCLKGLYETNPWKNQAGSPDKGEVCLLSLSIKDKRKDRGEAQVDVALSYQQVFSQKLDQITVVWTFARKIKAADPNWVLVAVHPH